MILVTVGTHTQGFERLMKKMDEIAPKLGKKVVMQIGHTQYKPRNCEYFDFASRRELEELAREAELVVTHGGEGNIIMSLSYHKPTIVVPRLKRYGEHVNDHQLDLTHVLEEEKRIIAVYDIGELEGAISSGSAKHIEHKTPPMIKIIKDYLHELSSAQD